MSPEEKETERDILNMNLPEKPVCPVFREKRCLPGAFLRIFRGRKADFVVMRHEIGRRNAGPGLPGGDDIVK